MLAHAAFHRASVAPGESPAEVARLVLAGHDGPLSDWERSLLEREIARMVALFRDREASLAGTGEPLGFEVAFGGDPEVRLGEEGRDFGLRGRIDRVDADGPDAVVIDYKLGAKSAMDGSKDGEKGLDLQLPLYAAVAERLYGVTVVGLEWVVARTRGRRGIWDARRADLAARRREGVRPVVLEGEGFRALLDGAVAAAGQAAVEVRGLVHEKQTKDAECCGTCRWQAVCRPLPIHLASGGEP
jgi:hypothetical protein